MLHATLNDVLSAKKQAAGVLTAPKMHSSKMILRELRGRYIHPPKSSETLGNRTRVVETQNNQSLREQHRAPLRAAQFVDETVNGRRHRHFHLHGLDEHQGIARLDSLTLRGANAPDTTGHGTRNSHAIGGQFVKLRLTGSIGELCRVANLTRRLPPT